MTQIKRKRISKAEKTQLKKDFLGSAFDSYKDFAEVYHEKYGRTAWAIRMMLSNLFEKKSDAKLQKQKFINQSLQEKAQMKIELEVKDDEVDVCPPPEDLFVEQEMVEKDDVMSLKGTITISINSGIFKTEIVSKNVNISKKQIVIEL